MEFAQQNYYQYPAFNIPYHPPAYPGMLGLMFVVTGVSQISARVFIALCAAGCGMAFYGLLRQLKVTPIGALGCALILLTTPEIVRWSRDTMSEVPGLFFLLCASLMFLRWLESGRAVDCLAAFVLAEVAFLSRITTIGIIPAWILFGLVSGRLGQMRKSLVLISCLVLFVGMNYAWLKFVGRYASFEVNADGRGEGLLLNYQYFVDCLPELLLTGSGGVMLLSLCGAVIAGMRNQSAQFWCCWLACFSVFKLVTPTSPETRHFFMALPAFAGMASLLFEKQSRRWPIVALWIAAISMNVLCFTQIPNGLIGYESVAQQMAKLEDEGNVLLAVQHDQDLIFRYRAHDTEGKRLMIRADRTLAIRLAQYARKQAEMLAQTQDDVLEIIRKGRIRYIVLATPANMRNDTRPEENKLLAQTMQARSDLFERVGESEYPLMIGFSLPGYQDNIALWRYRGSLPPGKCELQLSVPTAGMSIGPK